MLLTGAQQSASIWLTTDMLRAGKVGASTGFGLLIAPAVKLAVAVTMVGVFVASLLTHLTHPYKRHKNDYQITFLLDTI